MCMKGGRKYYSVCACWDTKQFHFQTKAKKPSVFAGCKTI